MDLSTLFDIVHDANMAKKFPDGTFHRRPEDGKILKPGKEGDVVGEIMRQYCFGSWKFEGSSLNVNVREHILTLRNFKSTLPLFWEVLVKIAKGLRTHNNLIIDDHRQNIEIEDDVCEDSQNIVFPLSCHRTNTTHIGICTKMIEKEYGFVCVEPIDKQDYTRIHPLAWTFPIPKDASSGMCKNRLYVGKSGYVHLSSYSTGIDFRGNDIENLKSGVSVWQKQHTYEGRAEYNFAVTVPDFINTVLAYH
jgi:hypothetical protein